MSNYKVVVCSHKRIDTLRKKTLSVLSSYGIPTENIYLFVAEDEMPSYLTAYPEYQIRQGAPGLDKQRNAVSAYFPSDEHLFCLDDDITGFYSSEGNKLKKIDNLDMFIRQGFEEAHKANASLWGLYPVKNAKWMKNTISEGLVFCYGCAFGLINKKDILIDRPLKEDFERSLKFFKRDGKVIRLNWVCPSQSYRKGSGGLQDFRTEERERDACKVLQAQYPLEVSIKEGKDRVDLRFKRSLVVSRPGHQN